MRIILYARAVARLSAATGIYPRFSLALHGLLNDSNLMHSEAPTNLIATYTKPHRLFFRMKGPFSASREPRQQLYRSSFQRSSHTCQQPVGNLDDDVAQVVTPRTRASRSVMYTKTLARQRQIGFHSASSLFKSKSK